MRAILLILFLGLWTFAILYTVGDISKNLNKINKINREMK